MALLDRVAALTACGGNEAFSEMRALYEEDAHLRVPAVINSYTRMGPRKVDLTGENEL
jgi:hypothetical protein